MYSTIKTGQIITITGNSACIADNAWSCGDYKIIEEPVIASPIISIPVTYIPYYSNNHCIDTYINKIKMLHKYVVLQR